MHFETFQWLLLGAVALIATAAALHALLYKREPSAAFGWIAVCLLFPLIGPVLYYMLGVNRIRIRARALRAEQPPLTPGANEPPVPLEFAPQALISEAVTGLALTGGNTVEVLRDGEEAYPVMLEAIKGAQHTVFLSTYIFESNRTGLRFAKALGAAVARGVDVRVLLDGAGEWYSVPRIRHRLREAGVRVGRFLPPRLLPPSLLLNLRNHRKILVVDGAEAFTGGMNIGDRHLAHATSGGIRDMHFRLTGPVVAQIEAVFFDDWRFATGDRRYPQHPVPAESGGALCRTIIQGPSEDLSRLTMVLVGAIAAARRDVVIVTPYFLPSRELISALQSAAIRGLRVDVVLPAINNLPFMHWATRNMLWELLKWGVHVHYRQGPFTHTKLFVVDGHYAQIGSANMDPRSLRLNFELVVEVYETELATTLAEEAQAMIADSREADLTELDGRSMGAKIRDAVCWLFTPYL